MGRLIDADTFMLALMDASLSSVDEDTILDLIDSIPTVDAVPVVHGRWVESQGGFWEVSKCSNCGEKYPTVGNARFCPNCGADMRELPEPPKEDNHA